MRERKKKIVYGCLVRRKRKGWNHDHYNKLRNFYGAYKIVQHCTTHTCHLVALTKETHPQHNLSTYFDIHLQHLRQVYNKNKFFIFLI